MTEDILGPLAESVEPELVTPMVVYLASEACGLTHEVFSAGGAGTRGVRGVGAGLVRRQGVEVSADDVAAHIDDIRNQDGYIVPSSIADELQALLPLLQADRPARRAGLDGSRPDPGGPGSPLAAFRPPLRHEVPPPAVSPPPVTSRRNHGWPNCSCGRVAGSQS